MKYTLQRLAESWHPMRILRLGIAIWGAIVSIQARDWAIGLFSAFFLYQAITNTGCCGAGACSAPRPPKSPTGEGVDVDYEEVK